MKEAFIPYRDERAAYESVRCRFLSSDQVSERNKELVLRFIDDAALGKTIFGRAKKKVGFLRLHAYFIHLTSLIVFLKKDLDQLEQADMERFIRALEAGEIMAHREFIFGRPTKTRAFPLSERTIVDRKVAIRKFYKWLFGRSRVFPPLVEWIDTSLDAKEVPALTEGEVMQMLDYARTTLQRVLIQVLFDGGFRKSELFNIRLRHVRLEQVQSREGPRKCFLVQVPFSKTERRTVALPMEETMTWLKRWLKEHPEDPVIQQDGTIAARNVDVQLFPVGESTINKILKKVGERAIGKHVWPHLMRHTSATWWANRGLPYFKLCKRFGWTMTSAMAKRYVDRSGVNELDSAKMYYDSSGRRAKDTAGASIPDEVENEKSGYILSGEVHAPLRILQTRLARGEIELEVYRELAVELNSTAAITVG